MRWFFLALSGILIGGLLHIVSLLAVPVLAPNDVYARLTALGGENTIIALPPSGNAQALPFLDPSFVYAACRFDLSEGPVDLRVPLVSSYVSMSFHERNGSAFFSLNDRSALGRVLDVEIRAEADEEAKALPVGAGTVAVMSPGFDGFVLIRALISSPSAVQMLREELAKSECRPRP